MIRRDYILRTIEEFIQALTRIGSLKRDRRWNEAADSLNAEFQRLIGTGAQGVARLSETDLLARLMQDGPTRLIHEKTFILTALLKEAGDVATAENREEEGRNCYLKALHLLLDTLARSEDFDFPDFVPRVDMLRTALEGAPLPLGTSAMLMQHYERLGEFARAEDALCAMRDAEPANERIAQFGISFYQRLQAKSDGELTSGGLPRSEVEEGLKDFQGQLKTSATAEGSHT